MTRTKMLRGLAFAATVASLATLQAADGPTRRDLNGARGTAFGVDLQRKSFTLLTTTQYDPKTKEGRSRFTVHWTDTTVFRSVVPAKNLRDLKGKRVAAFYYLDPTQSAAAKAGLNFKSPNVDILTDKAEPSGMRADGRRLEAWLSPNADDKGHRSGTVTLGEQTMRVGLARRAVVRYRGPASAADLKDGTTTVRVEGTYDADRFVAARVELTPLPDPRLSDDPNLPRVLVIGDSISMNYHAAAKKALEGKANYYRVTGNGGDVTRGVATLDLWLGPYWKEGFQWDVIQFNHGLHDLKQRFNAETKTWGPHQVEIPKYRELLEVEIGLLKKTGATLIWCSTTPVPNSSRGKYGRRKDEDLVYNSAALEVVKRHPEIRIDDLNAVVRGSEDFDTWRTGTNVHFKAKEQETLGKAVAETILLAAKASSAHPPRVETKP